MNPEHRALLVQQGWSVTELPGSASARVSYMGGPGWGTCSQEQADDATPPVELADLQISEKPEEEAGSCNGRAWGPWWESVSAGASRPESPRWSGTWLSPW